MQHFEDIWNEAEEVAAKQPGLNLQTVIDDIDKAIDEIEQSKDSITMSHAVGDTLFGLARLCVVLSRDGMNINSALAMRQAVNQAKADMLDPEDFPKEDSP